MELINPARRPDDALSVAAHEDARDALLRLIPRCALPRPHISARLDGETSVTIVHGPAGIGKTSAVAGWAIDADVDVAWVSVVTSDGARRHLWETVADALSVPAVIDADDPNGSTNVSPAEWALRLAAVLERSLDHDVVLVIDNYHVGEDTELAASMALFVRHQPRRLRLVILTRHVPDLPLDRMRVAGSLCEIDVDDLRFTPSDAERYLLMAAPDAERATVDAIIDIADGWPAALQLGARARTDARTDGHAHLWAQHLDRFVLRELLGNESESVVEFLTDLAIVERTSVALAEAITQRADAGTVLDEALDRGLFVSQVGVQGQYQVHRAVRGTLLAARDRREPARIVATRARAAAWLEASNETAAALTQWLQAGDHDNALRLLAERHLQLYDTGDRATVHDLLAKLSPEATARDVRSLVDIAWCQVIADPQGFEENVGNAVWWAGHGGAVDPDVERRLCALQAILALTHGEWALAEHQAHAALGGHPGWWSDPIIRSTWNDVARSIALSERWDEQADEVRELTVILRREPTRRLVLEATRALGNALAGSPVDALRIAGGVRRATTLAHLTMSANELALAEVIARREIGDGADAALELERLLDVETGPLTYLHGLAAAELVQLHLDHGSLSAATDAFGRLERIVTDEIPGAGGRVWLGRLGTVLAIDHGDHEKAAYWASVVDDPFWGPISRARTVALANAEREHASALVDEAVPRSPRHVVVRAMLHARTAPDRDVASTWVETAVETASARNLLQTLASTGQLDAIEPLAWRLPEGWMDRLRRATAVVYPQTNAGEALVEPLTVRERDVLRFLPSRLTLKEIAAELYVSVNTLKFHLKVIYRKLGVNSRAEAAEIVRSWGRVEQR